MKSLIFLFFGLVLGLASAQFLPSFTNAPHAQQPYADEQGRSISSLSAKDVEQLRKGAGWGLAKPAEFNGYPGPAHVIEFADKLNLSGQQRQAVEDSFQTMQERAKQVGRQLIDAELALDQAFINGEISKAGLVEALTRAEAARSKLRNIHLSAHLEVTPLLSEKQKEKYAELRGYGSGHAGHTGH